MNKFLTIANAWKIAIFHTEEQKKLADERMEVCNTCESLGEVNVSDMTGGIVDNYFMCIECRCPMQGKMFTPVNAPEEHKCPKKKWKK
jgi:hypothetical protein